MKTSPLVPHTVLESLEARIAPAGLVILTAKGGVLTISGDDEPNGLSITHLPDTGTWRIEDSLGGTTFRLNGLDTTAPFEIPQQNAIKGDLKGGNDDFRFIPASAPNITSLSGGINLKLGAGNDDFRLGLADAQAMFIQGPVLIDGGLGDDDIQMRLSATFAGNVKLLGGAGDDLMVIRTSAHHFYQKGFTIDFGTGRSQLELIGSLFAVSGPLNLLAAGEAGQTQRFGLNALVNQWDGPVSITVKAGETTVAISEGITALTQLGSTLKITTGEGTDIVDLDGKINAAGAISIDLKGGGISGNALILQSFAELTGTSLTLKGGAGRDAFADSFASKLQLSGALTLALGDGNNVWQNSGIVRLGLSVGSLNVTTGSGNDTFDFDLESFASAGSVSINLGAGNNTFNLDTGISAHIGGSLAYTGGVGSDTVNLDGPLTRIFGSLLLKPGAGANSIDIGGDQFILGGQLSYLGGTGADILHVDSTVLNIVRTLTYKGGPAGSDELLLVPVLGQVAAIHYTGGTGSDVLQIGDDNATTTQRLDVLGNVTFLPGSGDSTLRIVDSVIHGSTLATGKSLLSQTDTLRLFQSTFQGTVRILQGAADSTSDMDDVIMASDFFLDTGAGVDFINLETALGTSVTSRWFGKVTLQAGIGTDRFILGDFTLGDSNAQNIFFRDIIVDGGKDGDPDTFLLGATSRRAGSVFIERNIP